VPSSEVFAFKIYNNYAIPVLKSKIKSANDRSKLMFNFKLIYIKSGKIC